MGSPLADFFIDQKVASCCMYLKRLFDQAVWQRLLRWRCTLHRCHSLLPPPLCPKTTHRTDSLLWGHHLPPPSSQPTTVQMDLGTFGFLRLNSSIPCPQESRAPCPGSLWSSPVNICTGDVWGGGGGRDFHDATTTRSLLLITRLHFPNCYLRFHTSNLHSTHLEMTATSTAWTKLGTVSFRHWLLLH